MISPCNSSDLNGASETTSQPNASSRSQATRVEWVDYAKGIGIILVVYGHVVSGLSNAGVTQTLLPGLKYVIEHSVAGIYSFHMAIFFFIAGLFVNFDKFQNIIQQKTFYWKKIVNLMYPYIVWTVIFSITLALMAPYTNKGQFNIFEIPYKSVLNPELHLWFLYALCISHILFATLKQHFRSRVVLLISLILAIFAPWLQWGILFPVFNLFLYFVLASFLSKYILQSSSLLSKHLKTKWCYILAGVSAILHVKFIIAILPIFTNEKIHSITLLFPSSILGITTITLLSYGLSRQNLLGWIRQFGRYSLHIYIVHMLSWVAMRVLLQKILHTDQFFIHFVGGMVGGLVIPIGVAHLSERYCPWLFSAKGWVHPKSSNFAS
ncbi:MAG: hypothetical protein B0A82_10085 [Alkalinema sp. CACIAM 70d]|nr:MAG: hypothetical protein B0A82_10085 [Alkalinema sp. CACIAM 70d]